MAGTGPEPAETGTIGKSTNFRAWANNSPPARPASGLAPVAAAAPWASSLSPARAAKKPLAPNMALRAKRFRRDKRARKMSSKGRLFDRLLMPLS